MAKSKISTTLEQGRIVELQRRGLAQRAIANEIGRRRNLIADFVKNLDAYACKKLSGHPNKISPYLYRRIRRVVKRFKPNIK